MVNYLTNAEYIMIHRTAEEYRKRGYEVIIQTELDFLPGFQADLVVRKGAEVRVIEVKTRSSLAALPMLRELIQIIDSKPGWKFELVLVGEPDKLDSPHGVRSFDDKGVLTRLSEADRAIKAGLFEGALLIAWSALESAIRVQLEHHIELDNDVHLSKNILDPAVYYGIISGGDHRLLTDIRKYRDAIAHGLTFEALDHDLVTNLIRAVRDIVSNSEAIEGEHDEPLISSASSGETS